MGVPIENVATQGPGLTFITFPEAILLMTLPQLWAILFFFMMLTLGLGSQFGGIQMISTSIMDHWPHLRGHETKVVAGTCLFCFIAALPMTCNGGVYLFTLMEWHTASWAVLLIGFAECVVISWIYGIDRMFKNLREMGMQLKKYVKYYWKTVLVVVTPITCLSVFIFILTDLGATEFRAYTFPYWADIIGWMFGLMTLIPMFLFGGIEIFKRRNNLKSLFTPTSQWMSQELNSRTSA